MLLSWRFLRQVKAIRCRIVQSQLTQVSIELLDNPVFILRSFFLSLMTYHGHFMIYYSRFVKYCSFNSNDLTNWTTNCSFNYSSFSLYFFDLILLFQLYWKVPSKVVLIHAEEIKQGRYHSFCSWLQCMVKHNIILQNTTFKMLPCILSHNTFFPSFILTNQRVSTRHAQATSVPCSSKC